MTQNDTSTPDTERTPELPKGISVFQPQGREIQVLRTPDGETFAMEPERAYDLGRLLVARTEQYVEPGTDQENDR